MDNWGALQHISSKFLEELYWQKKTSTPEIAKLLGVSVSGIYQKMQRDGILTRSRSESAKMRPKKGCRKRNAQGYVVVWLASDDLFRAMARSDSFVYEHRLVMAKYLGRCLLSTEIVHHKNGVRDDNRRENLELFPAKAGHMTTTIMCQSCSFRGEAHHNAELEARMKKLEERIDTQEKLIRLLRWKSNPSKVKEL